jgi:alkanesulfonate monooxygenase SsuD/methylene tetrahydromethanopterin reductase-like flavin-dependent oxidoreductase (luciferase family)
VLGIGVGWLAEEFAALDVPFARRGLAPRSTSPVCKALWAGGEARFDGETYRLPPVRTGPRPKQSPHPPLWISGNSKRGIERAARIGDGWHGIDLSPDELARSPRSEGARGREAVHDQHPQGRAAGRARPVHALLRRSRCDQKRPRRVCPLRASTT